MEYSKIVSVTGMPGLYELISTKADGAVVRSLEDKMSHFVSSRIHNFSQLESIEVYTKGENVNLAEIFKAMDKSGEKLPDEKDPAAVKKYFEKVYSEMDFEKVYSSDQKKMLKWFSSLKKHNIEIKIPATAEEASAEGPKPETAQEKPAIKKENEK